MALVLLRHTRPTWRGVGCLDRAARTRSSDPTDALRRESGGDGRVVEPVAGGPESCHGSPRRCRIESLDAER